MGVALTARAAEVEVRVQKALASYHVHGAFSVAVPVRAAWNVLADYEHIGEFVTSVRGSKFIAAADGGRVLQQDAVAGVFPFRRSIRVALSLREHPPRSIEFRDVLKRDFQHYSGTWVLDADPGGTRVTYDLDAEPRGTAPGFVGRGVMARSSRDLLKQVRAEMLRRGDGIRAVAERDTHR